MQHWSSVVVQAIDEDEPLGTLRELLDRAEGGDDDAVGRLRKIERWGDEGEPAEWYGTNVLGGEELEDLPEDVDWQGFRAEVEALLVEWEYIGSAYDVGATRPITLAEMAAHGITAEAVFMLPDEFAEEVAGNPNLDDWQLSAILTLDCEGEIDPIPGTYTLANVSVTVMCHQATLADPEPRWVAVDLYPWRGDTTDLWPGIDAAAAAYVARLNAQ